MKKMLALTLALILCCCAACAQAVSSPALESFDGSGIKKKESPGKLQKTILRIMREKKSIRLKDAVTKNDSFFDAEGRETEVRDGAIEALFTPEVYRVKQDGTAELRLRLADKNAFQEKETVIVAGIPQGSGAHAGVKYIEIPAEAAKGKVQADFPAWVIKEMRRSISSGWNCVCLTVTREISEAPEEFMFEWPAEEDALTV